MTLLLILISISFIFSLRISYLAHKKAFDASEIILSFIVSYIFFVAISFVLCLFITLGSPTRIIEYDTPIKSVNLNSRIRGTFSILYGSINQRDYYYTYVGDKCYKLVKFNINNTYIIETDSKPPKIRQYIKEYIPNWYVFFQNKEVVRNELYVPIGVIVEEYNLKSR